MTRTMKTGMRLAALLLITAQYLLSGFAAAAEATFISLAGTRWQLLEFQSSDDAIGTLRPADPTQYAMTLNADGSASLQLNCNTGSGNWSAVTSPDGASGSFSLGPLAVTRALCAPPSLDQQIARDADYIRSYVLQDGLLHLGLMADGGIYSWIPMADASAAAVYAAPAEGGPRVWRVADIDSYLVLRTETSKTAYALDYYLQGTLLDNLGCLSAEGRAWCEVQKMQGGQRGYVDGEYLVPAVAPDGTIPTGADDSALRAGNGIYDASGILPCSQVAGTTMQGCSFGVARAGGGDATVVVTRPDGSARALFFHYGRFNGADTSQADGYPDTGSELVDDVLLVTIGEERYEVADEVIYGD